ncbi:MarR family winged helix-turn-helix transcriptional regulator [Massilia suwonensis]|uniref:MarR family winged helix-turn-helix transcriptional regulator n=1 Tax=Massilia suwonensis TaxID=648895 RepID=A0ABW0MN04_9BURK
MKKPVDKVNQNPAPSAQDVFEAIHSIMHLYRARQMRTPADTGANAEPELTHMEGKVLGFFARNPDATLSDLVAHSGRDKAQLTRLIRALRDRELLEARADAADKRSTRLRLSSGGEALHALRHRQGAAAAEAALAGLPDAEREQLAVLLERVRANLDAADQE